jgi:predicted phosphohydrolase
MRVQYISDIHLELLSPKQINEFNNNFKPTAEICILAGDIGNPYDKSYTDFLFFCNKNFKKIFLIAGNHEYYKNKVTDTKKKISSICVEFENISFLDNSFEDYKGYRFIGSTLWSEIKKKQFTINDTQMIKDFNVDGYISLHNECILFLDNTLANCSNNSIKSILITHHLPIYDLTVEKYRDSFYSNYNQWFHANIDEIVQKNSSSISSCIYGHTHCGSIQKFYGVDFYCNPLGYDGENNVSNINKFFDIVG